MLAANYVAAFAERNAFRRRLQASQLELIQRLAQAIDSRNAETGEHTHRIGILCRRLALELGWSPAEAESLRHAAVAHDVGKIGVGDNVLLKPGPLDAQEWEVMKAPHRAGRRAALGLGEPADADGRADRAHPSRAVGRQRLPPRPRARRSPSRGGSARSSTSTTRCSPSAPTRRRGASTTCSPSSSAAAGPASTPRCCRPFCGSPPSSTARCTPPSPATGGDGGRRAGAVARLIALAGAN